MTDYDYESMAWLAAQAGVSLATLGRRARDGDFPPTFYVGRCRLVRRNDGLMWADTQRRGTAA